MHKDIMKESMGSGVQIFTDISNLTSSALKNFINVLIKVWAYFLEAKKVSLYSCLDLRVQAIVMTVVRLGALTNFLRRETKGSNLKPIVTIELTV